jgi:hypothetical protein
MLEYCELMEGDLLRAKTDIFPYIQKGKLLKVSLCSLGTLCIYLNDEIVVLRPSSLIKVNGHVASLDSLFELVSNDELLIEPELHEIEVCLYNKEGTEEIILEIVMKEYSNANGHEDDWPEFVIYGYDLYKRGYLGYHLVQYGMVVENVPNLYDMI